MISHDENLQDDKNLRAHFRALRRVDADNTPSIDTLLNESRRPRGRSMFWTPTSAVAAMVIFAAGVSLVAGRIKTKSESVPDSSISVRYSSLLDPSLLLWQSPTASLLQTPEGEMLLTSPDLQSTILEHAVRELHTTYHNER